MFKFEPINAYIWLMRYNWQLSDWPEFTYSEESVMGLVLSYTERMGRVSGMVSAFSEKNEAEVHISALVAEVMKTSEIEGEYLSREDVMSSIRNHLGLNTTPQVVRDKRANGIVKMALYVQKTYAAPLSESDLFEWHRLLMEGNQYIKAGQWRSSKEPVQVVSGAAGREVVHFEAPPSSRVPTEMDKFIRWFNDTAPNGKNPIAAAPVRSAIAHLYFESIHPFEDGNGRVGRALSEKVLSQHAGRPVILSLSQVIQSDKKAYYAALQRGQQSNEINDWITYFTGVITKAQHEAEEQIAFEMQKTRFFDRHRETLSQRQLKVVKKMLNHGSDGFEGGMSAKKYASITGASKATATRDLQELVEKGIFTPQGEGRSRRYLVALF